MTSRSALQPQIRVVSADNIAQTRRVPRKPQHRWNVQAKPHEICPIMIAPVLPGETMQSLLMQARVVTDPIKDPLIGWFQEYYFAYVSHRGLFEWDTTGKLQSMMLDPATDVSTLKAAANSLPYYTFNGGMDFMKAATEVIVNEWFRDEDETPASAMIENYFAAQLDQGHWAHSFKLDAAGADDPELPGVDELEEMDILPGFSTNYAQWELMRDAGMTDLTYEDYLESYGVDVPKAEEADPAEKHKPEIIRYFRKWSYPSNVIDPATGAPSSAVFWDVAEKADKKRFFKEPGFIVGFSLTRPKLYLGNQQGSAVGLLDDPYSWLPAVLNGHPYVSVQQQLDDDVTFKGILQNQAGNYWIDTKDLFLHGDEFRNRALEHAVAVPTAAGGLKYPTEAMIDTLFKTVGSEYVRQDGIAHLNILSRLSETTP